MSMMVVSTTSIARMNLPDPLQRHDGTRVASARDWPARRDEVLELFRRHMYGRSPGSPEHLAFDVLEENPAAMGGDATMRRVAITCGQGELQHRFEVAIFVPNRRTAPAPLFLLINNRHPDHTDPTRARQSDFWPAEQAVARGYAIAAFHNATVAPDHADTWRSGVARLFEDPAAPRADDGWGALGVWAWAASRVMDYLETSRDIDAARVAVIGHSRGGKTALWAGAQDTRFALTISNNSGCGGAALSRHRQGESVAQINDRFPHWFCPRFHSYADREDQLPVDQHMLIALMAPRAVYVASAADDHWADPPGEFAALAHASPVFALWDAPPIAPDAMPPVDQPLHLDRRGYHIRTGGHGLTRYDWQRYFDFADRLWPRP